MCERLLPPILVRIYVTNACCSRVFIHLTLNGFYYALSVINCLCLHVNPSQNSRLFHFQRMLTSRCPVAGIATQRHLRSLLYLLGHFPSILFTGYRSTAPLRISLDILFSVLTGVLSGVSLTAMLSSIFEVLSRFPSSARNEGLLKLHLTTLNDTNTQELA